MTQCRLYRNYPRYLIAQMWEQMTKIEIPNRVADLTLTQLGPYT
jgi:hypothetical protein